MRKNAFRYLAVLMTGVTVGLVTGVAGFSSLVAYRLDGYHAKIRQLENTIEDRDNRLKKLEESINAISKQKYILKDVEIYLIYEGDELDRIEFEKHINEKYRHLVGQEVSKIDAELAAEVVDKRIFLLDDKKYKLKVEKLILAEVMKIWINISVLEE